MLNRSAVAFHQPQYDLVDPEEVDLPIAELNLRERIGELPAVLDLGAPSQRVLTADQLMSLRGRGPVLPHWYNAPSVHPPGPGSAGLVEQVRQAVRGSRSRRQVLAAAAARADATSLWLVVEHGDADYGRRAITAAQHVVESVAPVGTVLVASRHHLPEPLWDAVIAVGGHRHCSQLVASRSLAVVITPPFGPTIARPSSRAPSGSCRLRSWPGRLREAGRPIERGRVPAPLHWPGLTYGNLAAQQDSGTVIQAGPGSSQLDGRSVAAVADALTERIDDLQRAFSELAAVSSDDPSPVRYRLNSFLDNLSALRDYRTTQLRMADRRLNWTDLVRSGQVPGGQEVEGHYLARRFRAHGLIKPPPTRLALLYPAPAGGPAVYPSEHLYPGENLTWMSLDDLDTPTRKAVGGADAPDRYFEKWLAGLPVVPAADLARWCLTSWDAFERLDDPAYVAGLLAKLPPTR